jgi:signal transduction histidine kinase
LLHDVSHELRSPLARLNAIVGLARQQPENIEESLSRLERESVRMDRLLAELLTLSRLESGLVARFDETVDLGALLGDVVDDAGPEIGQAGFKVELAAAEGTLVSGDAELLHRLFDNLLRNALIHAARGGWVGIRLSARAGVAIVTVEDRGAGVPDAELDQLFVAFYRGRGVVNAAKAADARGHGLGLAIARQIAEQHGGRIKAANRDGGGLCVTVALPVTKEPD